ncbi:MAG: carboxypeptidase-like regulatory domain-containing protein [Gemmatimonadota bacterium]
MLTVALLVSGARLLPAQAIVSGFVRDSLSGRPLAGATIQLVSSVTPWAAGRTVTSDSIGRYRIDSVAPGTYALGFQHPRLDTLGMDAVSRTLDVPPRIRVLRADLALPSGQTFVLSLCGASRDSAGAVIGRVFDAASNAPVSDGIVTVRWAQVQLGSGGVGRTMMQTTARFGADGRFVACNVPTGAPVLVSARAGSGDAASSRGTSSEIELTFDARSPLVHRNLLIATRGETSASGASASAASVTARDSTVAGSTPAVAPPAAPIASGAPQVRRVERTGTARLDGRVTAADGSPVSGARVHVVDTDRTATTDTLGAFRITGLPAGTRAVEVTAIGFAPLRTSADLRPDRDARLAVSVGPRIATLAAVDVVAPTDRSGFLKRRAAGNGYFLDGNTIEQRGALNVAQALVTAPTLRGNGFDRSNPTRPLISGRGNCRPTAYMDGQRMQDGLTGIDDILTVRRVGGIEVYGNPSEAPAQYRGNGACAVILVWTRAYVP